MRFLTSLTLTVCVLSVLYTALMMLVPDRYRRELRSVFALITVVTIGSIVLGTDISDISAEFGNLSFDSSLYSSDRLVLDELEKRIEEYAVSLLEEQGINCKKLNVWTTIDEQRRIFITKASLTMGEENRTRETYVKALIREKIGDIEVEINYEDG